MNYEELLIEADSNNLITKEKPLLANAGRIKGNGGYDPGRGRKGDALGIPDLCGNPR